ncbi:MULTISPECIES: hypothetical protein [Flavobacterium]|uniref:50S ribosomal protein L27 n=1 Tax=Flavobacterium aurantiibacter TaxID=2023067 RepID=A0A255ZWT2_9FLAO|nr:hypothetical protein [Flavobacterium aurantiibacter]OYQ45953.1 hypothetical protein CHX27_05410 [Flavobacterium aurantiibacter]
MYNFLQHAHSGWAYIVLIVLFFTVLNAVMSTANAKAFSDKDRKLALFALIASHVQLLLGLVLWFVSPIGKAALSQMQDASLRLTALEHPLTNIIAIVLITIGWSRHKKMTDSGAIFKNFLLFYGLGLVLILTRIPWQLWF